MTTRDIALKLRAWDAGRPLTRYSTLHHALVPADQTMLVAFVRMAGESRPWGIAWGTADAEPTMQTVPDGRVRDDVAVLCAAFAEDLLAHMRVHNWTYDPVDERAEPADLRQLWLPNSAHVAMLHQLDYAYSQTKHGGSNLDVLRSLGRLCGWLFRDSTRTGHQHLVDASQALRDAFVFPAQNARSAHLGYLLAWLTADGSRADHIEAATAAEGLTVSPTLDPTVERDTLSKPVEAWNLSRRDGHDNAPAAGVVDATLRVELERRWDLTRAAYELLSNDDRKVNAGVPALVKEAHQEFWFSHQRVELRLADPTQGKAYVAHPETDFHGSSAASRYLQNEAADEAFFNHLVHDDTELLDDALEAGDAIRGEVVQVRDEGVGRTTKPFWVVRVDPTAPNRLRENGRLVPYGSAGHEATIRSIDATDDGLDVTIEWTKLKTRALTVRSAAKPADPSWQGTIADFVSSDAADLTKRRSQRVWKAKDGAGAWLTHGRQPAPTTIETDDGVVEQLIDDTQQIENGALA
ncbi:hypothetical protein FB00_13500 [Cellulosimicrobium funkei]|uniref:Uncharacterized protein n=1 Tax=Cellulosimicrobium funkei TaxID=264251 RepID=A0A0H2KLZ5_9MICO|nr:hypothetical protein [Cellulosimicrobium funkei]KLN34188.1 hypothetical protein FB00_13500 [Cellulosimicrobium funkei]